MADNNHQRGFRPFMGIGGVLPPRPIKMAVASAYQGQNGGAQSIDLCIGDPVKRVSDGTVAHAAAGDVVIMGVVVGICPFWSASLGAMTFGDRLPGGTTYTTLLDRQSFVMVQPVNDMIFEVDCDDAVTATTFLTYQALIGENCDHAYTVGSEPISDCNLDISDHKTATAQWRIVDISPTMNNRDFSGAFVKLLVTCNESTFPPFSTSGI